MDGQGEGAEIAIIPRGRVDDTCPVTALKTWLELSGNHRRAAVPQGQPW